MTVPLRGCGSRASVLVHVALGSVVSAHPLLPFQRPPFPSPPTTFIHLAAPSTRPVRGVSSRGLRRSFLHNYTYVMNSQRVPPRPRHWSHKGRVRPPGAVSRIVDTEGCCTTPGDAVRERDSPSYHLPSVVLGEAEGVI